LKNFIFYIFIILVFSIWYLLSIDYFGIYEREKVTTLDGDRVKLILHQADRDRSAISVDYLAKHLSRFRDEPFSGIVLAGDSFTDRIFSGDDIKYMDILQELQPLADLNISQREIFLLVNIDFAGDLWDSAIWSRVTKNFANLAKVALELNIKGIVLDSNPKSSNGKMMVNFKFPSRSEIKREPDSYEAWEIAGAKFYKSVKIGYRNPNYTFSEHIRRVTQIFRKIMVSISTNYPDITLMVYSGVDLNSHKRRPNVYQKALFLGLQRGAGDGVKLYDMGYIYSKSRKEMHFQNSYFWRKYGVAEDRYNDELNGSWQWKIPKGDRVEWTKRVKVGFIIDTDRLRGSRGIASAVKRAFIYSDGYVVLFSNRDNWLVPRNRRRMNTLRRRVERALN